MTCFDDRYNLNLSVGRFIFTLDKSGQVICYDHDVLLPIYQFDGVDQIVLSDQDKTTKRTLTVDRNMEHGSHSIVMRAFLGNNAHLWTTLILKLLADQLPTGLEAEYRVQVNDFCLILTSAEQNDIIFIEGARDPNGNVTTIRIRSMTEGRPIDR